MYDLILVRRRRRRKIAALVALFSSIGVSSLVTISFLGQYTGTFTISLTNSSVRLSLSDKVAFTNPTSYLRIEKLDDFEEGSYYTVLQDKLDDEEKPYDYGNEISQEFGTKVLKYFKYTFYVGNMGSKAARYNLKINLVDRTKSSDGTDRTLDDTLRVMVYENDIDDTDGKGVHTEKVYAKERARGSVKDKEGHDTTREFIATPSFEEDEDHPLAESFEDYNVVKTYKRGAFYPNQICRYTIVMWLEGDDPDSDGKLLHPEGATLKLGVEITAYENE